MLRTRDNWERLVGAVLKKQQLWELCHADSTSSTVLSESSSSTDLSRSCFREIDPSSAHPVQKHDLVSDSVPAFDVDDINLEILKLFRNFDVENVSEIKTLSADLRPHFPLLRSGSSSSNKPLTWKSNVTVNGHSISDALVKEAEKLAGPIKPGNYWYDYRAGFWGVMGGPCLGITLPLIEEFNYPMPEDCAGGNTRVFVNGRELNQKDLTLLSTRGLPNESQRSYIIEISGRVLDEGSGEELESLGKLAPTVEKAKRGFGMKVPKAKRGFGISIAGVSLFDCDWLVRKCKFLSVVSFHYLFY